MPLTKSWVFADCTRLLEIRFDFAPLAAVSREHHHDHHHTRLLPVLFRQSGGAAFLLYSRLVDLSARCINTHPLASRLRLRKTAGSLHAIIENLFFDGTLDPDGGWLSPGAGNGNGLSLRTAVADRYRVG